MQDVTVVAVQWVLQGQDDQTAPRQRMAANARRVAETIDRVCAGLENRPGIVLFPVLMLTGIGTALRQRGGASLSFERSDVAIDLEAGDPILDPVIAACARNGVLVATSCVEASHRMAGHYFHTGVVLDGNGLVLRSPKTQAPTSAGITLLHTAVDEYIAAYGEDAVLPVAATGAGTIACLVEGEYLVPEAVRTVARRGAEIVLQPTAQRVGPGQAPNTALKQAVAYTNAVYWVSAVASREQVAMRDGRVEAWFGGGSCVIAPDGAVMTELTGPDEGVVSARLDAARLVAAREHQGPHTTPADIVYRNLYRGGTAHAPPSPPPQS